MSWQLLRVDAGTHTDPRELPAEGWVAAVVPGGIGATLPTEAATADEHAWWLRRRVSLDGGPHELVLDGLGTYADVYLDGERIASSDNAFRAQHVPLGELSGEHDLAVRLGAPAEVTPPRKPRARWRSALLPDATMRWRRSPHLGRIPSWQGAHPYVGVVGELDVRPARPRLIDVRTRRADGRGTVEVRLDGADAATVVRIGSVGTTPVDGAATVELPHAPVWMPHTHGAPATVRLVVEHHGETVEERRIGFSDIEIRGTDATPSVVVNGREVFVRGACWVPTDAATWVDDPQRVRRDLETLRDAGINAVRLTGTNRYEPNAFWDTAAELGLLVWQDVMLATFDPPEDDTWLAGFEAELRDRLGRLQGRPNVLAVCGGTETEQQPTLMGLDPAAVSMTAVHDLLPRLCAELLPGAPHVTSSPSGGPLPTSVSVGFSHYFGVGAYLRPLDDARSARVAFASESLAFAIPPEAATVREDHPGGIDDVRAQDWRDGVPSDRGVEWGFDDVTDHYVTELFGLRRDDVDAARWLDLERAAVVDAMTRTFAVWRSPASPTGGAFVLSHADLRSGPGWGLLDHHGRPKAPLLALHDVLAPTALLLVDHGLDGLSLDVVHDDGTPLAATLLVHVFAAGDQPVGSASLPVTGPTSIHVERALGGFRDLTYAWRFGDRYYRAVHARLVAADGTVLADTVRLLDHPQPADPGPSRPPLTAVARAEDDGCLAVDITATDLAEFVHVDADGATPDTGWFHLVPGQTRTIRLRPTNPTPPAAVQVRATNAGIALDLTTAPSTTPSPTTDES